VGGLDTEHARAHAHAIVITPLHVQTLSVLCCAGMSVCTARIAHALTPPTLMQTPLLMQPMQPGVFVHSIATGEGEYRDIWSSFMGNVNSQVGASGVGGVLGGVGGKRSVCAQVEAGAA